MMESARRGNELGCLPRERFDDRRMRVPEDGGTVGAHAIEIFAARVVPQARPLPAHQRDAPFSVDVELVRARCLRRKSFCASPTGRRIPECEITPKTRYASSRSSSGSGRKERSASDVLTLPWRTSLSIQWKSGNVRIATARAPRCGCCPELRTPLRSEIDDQPSIPEPIPPGYQVLRRVHVLAMRRPMHAARIPPLVSLDATRLRSLTDMIDRVEQVLDRTSRRNPGVSLLKTIPGVGPRTAEAVVA